MHYSKYGTSKITRRGFLVSTTATIAGFTLPIPTKVKADELQEYSFVVAADPQLFWGAIENWNQTVDQINRLKADPDFLIVCGDLIHKPGNMNQLDAYKDGAESLNIEKYEIPGNHDIGNPPTLDSLSFYKEQIGPLYDAFEYKNSLFIMLASDLFKNPPSETEAVAEEQIRWLEQTFEEAKSKDYVNKFVFMHHPMILETMDESEEYFNLPVKIRDQLFNLFKSNSVDIVFSGHWHRNRVIKLDNIEFVITGSCGVALGDSAVGFRVVKVSGSNIEHTYRPLPDQSLKDGTPSD